MRYRAKIAPKKFFLYVCSQPSVLRIKGSQQNSFVEYLSIPPCTTRGSCFELFWWQKIDASYAIQWDVQSTSLSPCYNLNVCISQVTCF